MVHALLLLDRMKIAAILTTMCLASVASAEGTELVQLLERAHDAAVAGDCSRVVHIAALVHQADNGFYETTFVGDPAVASCIEEAHPAPAAEPVKPTHWSPVYVPVELAAGTVTAIPGALLGAEILRGDKTGDHAVGAAVFGAMIGWSACAPVGVYIAGSVGDFGGSFAATEAGGLVGGLVGVAAFAGGDGAGVLTSIIAPVVGATIGFNLTRHAKTERARVWVPTAAVTRDHAQLGIAGRF